MTPKPQKLFKAMKGNVLKWQSHSHDLSWVEMPISESKAESRETHKEAAKAWQSISREDMQHLMMSVERIATDSHLSNNNYIYNNASLSNYFGLCKRQDCKLLKVNAKNWFASWLLHFKSMSVVQIQS